MIGNLAEVEHDVDDEDAGYKDKGKAGEGQDKGLACTAALALAVSCSTYVLLGSSSPSATMGMVGPSKIA